MVQIAKILNGIARIVGFTSSILYHKCKISTNDTAVSISPLRKLIISSLEQKESLINEGSWLSLIVCDSLKTCDSIRTDKKIQGEAMLKKLTVQTS